MAWLLAKHNFPLSPNWPIHELTAHVLEDDNLNNLSFLIDTVQDCNTISIALLEIKPLFRITSIKKEKYLVRLLNPARANRQGIRKSYDVEEVIIIEASPSMKGQMIN